MKMTSNIIRQEGTMSEKEYLKNDICKFTPLFDIDYSKKKNIFSAVFFKLRGKPYKKFVVYIQGLKNLSEYVKRNVPSYTIRLFIDRSIHNDKKIMKIIRRLKNVEPVLYHCEEYVVNKNYHRGLFGALVRYFPMFDFENNDANIVRVADIDFIRGKDDTRIWSVTDDLKKLKKLGIYDKIYYYASSRLFHIGLKKGFVMNNRVIPYAIAPKGVSLKRLDKNVLTQFIRSVNKPDRGPLTFYEKTINVGNKAFIFGADEHFLNRDLIRYLLRENLPFTLKYSYNIISPYFWAVKEYDDFTKEQKRMVNLAIDFVLQQDNNQSYQEKFKMLDKILYVPAHKSLARSNITDRKTISIVNRMYLVYKLFEKKKTYFFPFTKDFVKLAIKNKGVIQSVLFETHTKNSSKINIVGIRHVKESNMLNINL
jgi:hypothetical protein